jgi:hypothetical protein
MRNVTTHTFALLAGIAYLALGVLGLIPGYGYFLGTPPVNLPLVAVHVALGLWGLVAWAGNASVTRYARSLALICGLLAAIGLIPVLDPLHVNNLGLHALTAIAAAYFGWRAPATSAQRRQRSMDRRQYEYTVERDRRRRISDRRRDSLAFD